MEEPLQALPQILSQLANAKSEVERVHAQNYLDNLQRNSIDSFTSSLLQILVQNADAYHETNFIAATLLDQTLSAGGRKIFTAEIASTLKAIVLTLLRSQTLLEKGQVRCFLLKIASLVRHIPATRPNAQNQQWNDSMKVELKKVFDAPNEHSALKIQCALIILKHLGSNFLDNVFGTGQDKLEFFKQTL